MSDLGSEITDKDDRLSMGRVYGLETWKTDEKWNGKPSARFLGALGPMRDERLGSRSRDACSLGGDNTMGTGNRFGISRGIWVGWRKRDHSPVDGLLPPGSL